MYKKTSRGGIARLSRCIHQQIRSYRPPTTVAGIANEHPVRARSTAMVTTPAQNIPAGAHLDHMPLGIKPYVHEFRQMNMYLN